MTIDPLDAIQTRTLDILRRYVPPGTAVALLDYPCHSNAGDTLIYAGERAYLKRLGAKITYEIDLSRYAPSELRYRHPEGPILMHGGGNLGDRWGHFQLFRERVVQDFPDRQIVVMPQSIEFRDPAQLERARRIFGKHRNLTILLRETPSFEKGKAAFGENDVVYCPDAAFGVGYLKPLQRPEHDVVMVLRGNSERVERGIANSVAGAQVTDWGFKGLTRYVGRALSFHRAITMRCGNIIPRMCPMIESEFALRTWMNMNIARRIVSSGRIVVSDRLHAAVFAALTARPVICLDNVYGKISSIYRDYLHTMPGVQYAISAEEVGAAVEALSAGSRLTPASRGASSSS